MTTQPLPAMQVKGKPNLKKPEVPTFFSMLDRKANSTAIVPLGKNLVLLGRNLTPLGRDANPIPLGRNANLIPLGRNRNDKRKREF